MPMTKTSLETASALDPSYYTRDDVYAFEMTHIIAPSWQIIARAGLVSGSGDVIARKLGDVPIIVLRTPSGQLKGFYNICPHRAGPLATCDARGTKRLRCGYHGWAYSHDGDLKSAPEMTEAENFDLQDIRLTPIDVKEWNGLIFARTGNGPSFDDVYGGIDEIIGDGLKNLSHHKSILYEVECNWKVYADNYLEGYHLPFVHPGLTSVVDYADYITELGEYWSVQRSPVDEDCGPYAAGEGLYFFIHPNTMFNIMPGRLQTNRIVPTGLKSCQVEFEFYYGPGAEFRAEDDFKFSDEVQEEDRMICEHVQKGLTSGVYKPGRLSPARENGVWHWQNILRDIYMAADI